MKRAISIMASCAIITSCLSNEFSSGNLFAVLASSETILINSQPQSISAVVGATVSFTVEAEGEGLTYVWKSRFKDGEWGNSKATGNKTKKLTLTATEAKNGAQYQCIITDKDGNTLTSDAATLTIKASDPIIINSQPQSISAVVGATVSFTVEAEGEGLTYVWKSRFKDGEWGNSKATGNKTKKLTLTATEAKNGAQYQCIITDKDGNTLTSEPATLTIASPITLTDPSNITITSTSSAIFTCTAAGTGDLTYQWEYLGPEDEWISIPDSNSATLTINGADAVDGTQYRCTVSDNYGQSKTSNAATLTVEAEDNQCGDNLTYTFKDGVLTLSGSGEMWSYTDAASSPFNDLTITSLVIPDGVTVIGAHAFEGTTIQNPVVLPESVFSVRYRAFWNIQNLDITIENIGCAVYDQSIADTATVRGYESSSAYHCSQLDTMTFVSLDAENNLDAATNKIVLTVGDTYQIPATGSGLKYFSFNTNVATVSNTGLVTAVGVDDYDQDVKVMVYDKKGKSTVYYFAVVNEQTTPEYGWRYSVVSPACNDQLPFVPFWGERVSLNTDVANIVNWDHAEPTGQFGTAPIVSADDRGNAFVFYFTYDADIRPVKADETYTEHTYQFSNTEGSDWERTYYLPYYAYTAEENTRVYFKAYGSEDLDVRVFDAPGGNEIAWDYNGGRAEVEFDVAAGHTVYIQCESGQNQAFEYTMKLSTDSINSVSMTDNETYTISSSTAGDLTTYSFTAPSTGTYLIEAKGSKSFHYDIANNSDFTDVEYDDNGYQLNESSKWHNICSSFDRRLMTYYAYINEGETVYLRGWFDEETNSDDFISFRVHAVETFDDKISVNDFEYPNELSLNPDDFDRRVFYGTEGTQYIISTNDHSADLIILDQDWNLVGYDTTYTEEGYTYYFKCDEDQLYHLMVQPQYASDNYGTVNVAVMTQQEQAVNLGTNYTVYNTRKAPVNYTFTAASAGYYYFDTSYDGITSYEVTDENGIVTEEAFDNHFSLHIMDGENEIGSYYNVEPGRSDWSCYFYLEEGQAITFNFDQDQIRGTDHIDFILNKLVATAMTVDNVVSGSLNTDSYKWYCFTAPTAGSYMITAASDSYWFDLWTENGDYSGSQYNGWYFDGHYDCYFDLAEGETVWFRINSNEDTDLDYSVIVTQNDDDIIPEEVCDECGGTDGHHEEWCSQYEVYVEEEGNDDEDIVEIECGVTYTVPKDRIDTIRYAFPEGTEGIYVISPANGTWTQNSRLTLYCDDWAADWIDFSSGSETQMTHPIHAQSNFILGFNDYSGNDNTPISFVVTKYIATRNQKTLALNETKEGSYGTDAYDVFKFVTPEAGTYTFKAQSVNDWGNWICELYEDEDDIEDISNIYSGNTSVTYTAEEAGIELYLRPRSLDPYSSFDYTITVEKENDVEEYINGIPVVATIDWGEISFTTSLSEVYVKALMADGGPSRNFEADSTINKTMYIYLPSDMNTAVASDTYPSNYSRVLDFYEYDESGYVYVKLVSSSGSPLGTVTCTLEDSPMIDF